jgi:hypothetical protein
MVSNLNDIPGIFNIAGDGSVRGAGGAIVGGDAPLPPILT